MWIIQSYAGSSPNTISSTSVFVFDNFTREWLMNNKWWMNMDRETKYVSLKNALKIRKQSSKVRIWSVAPIALLGVIKWRSGVRVRVRVALKDWSPLEQRGWIPNVLTSVWAYFLPQMTDLNMKLVSKIWKVWLKSGKAIFSRVLRDSTPRFVRPSVGRSVGRSLF